MNQVKTHFRPEFINRLDEIIMFKPLTKSNIGRIVDLQLAELNARMDDRQIKVVLTDQARDFIIDHGYEPAYGARPLKRYIQKTVETLVARIILQGQIDMGDSIKISVKDDQLSAEKE